MLKLAQSHGLIIKIATYKDNAVLATILDEKQKNNYIIRGAKKINSRTRHLANILIELDFYATTNAAINTITEANIINNYTNIKENYLKMQVAYVVLEKVNIFADSVNDSKLFFEFVKQTLILLNNYNYPYIILAIFEIKLLYLLGISPQINECLNCGKKNPPHVFSALDGGVYCLSCAQNIALDVNETQIFKIFYYIKMNRIDEDFLKLLSSLKVNFNQIIDEYYQNHLDFTSKTKRIIEKL